MAPKRKALQSPSFPSEDVKSAKLAGSPPPLSSDDGDIVIQLGHAQEMSLRLHKTRLSRSSAYFQKVGEEGWPEKFVLPASTNSTDFSKWRVVGAGTVGNLQERLDRGQR